MRGILLLSLFLTASATVDIYGQVSPFRRYTVADGLTENRVMSIYEDRLGFLWLLSQNGITRFDGSEMIPYTVHEGLPAVRPENILEDNSGNIWVLTKMGLARYNGYGFEAMPLPEERNFMELSELFCIDNNDRIVLNGKDDNGKNVLLEFTDGLYKPLIIDNKEKLDGVMGQLIYSKEYKSVITWIDNKAYFVKNGEMIQFFQYDNLYFYEKDGLTYANINNKPDFFRFADTTLQSISLEDYYRVTGEPYAIRNPMQTYINLNKVSDNHIIKWQGTYINSTLRDKNGNVWVGTEDGFYKLLSDELVLYDQESGIASDIWSVTEDQSGNLWFTSINGLIQKYNGTDFENLSDRLPEGVKNFTFGSRLMSDGKIWFTTFKGIIEWDGSGFRRLNLVNYQVEYIFEDVSDGTIMLGSNIGLLLIEGKDRRLYEEMRPFGLGFVRDICKIGDKSFIIVSHKGCYEFDMNEFTLIDSEPALNINPFSARRDNKGKVWLGGDGGLFVYDPLTKEVKRPLSEGNNVPVRALECRDSNSIIAGRFGDFLIINTDSTDTSGFYSCTSYNEDKGFFSSGFLQNGILRDSRGSFWFTGNDRIIKYRPGEDPEPEGETRLFITSVEVLSQSGEWIPKYNFSPFSDNSTGPVMLNHNDINTRISYISTGGDCAGATMYRYRTDRGSSLWSVPLSERHLILPGLRKGRSVLTIEALSADGKETLATSQLVIQKRPAIWETLPFWIVATLLLVGLTYLLSRYFLRRKDRLEELKLKTIREQYRLQMGSFIQQFDPHFTFNVLNSLSAFYRTGREDEADEYLARFARLLRTVISETDYTRTLDKEIKFISGYCDMQKIKMGNRLNFMVEVDDPQLLETQVPRMMIHNFVENSIKWGLNPKKDGGEIKIKVSRNGGTSVIISDTGIGRNEAAKLNYQGTGKGLSVTKSLIEVLNSNNKKKIGLRIDDLHIENGHSYGTIVEITFPDEYNYFLKD